MVNHGALERFAPRAGMLGSVVIGACSLIAALAYRGVDGEAYSPLNHFVSELGEPGVSALAPVFNAGLLVGGACFATWMVGLGAIRGGVIGWAFGLLGAVAGVAASLVGVFPLDQVEGHQAAAFTFFNLGWIAIILASVDILVHPDRRFPFRTGIAGLIAAAGFVGFIWAYAVASSGSSRTLEPVANRPDLDVVAAFEWAAILGTIAWTFIGGLAWVRAPRLGVT